MYKDELRQCRLQKAAVEEQLNNVELELARWRFEALKSRCLIIHREQLLEDSGIAFDADATVAPAIVQQARRMESMADVRPQMQLVRPKIEPKVELTPLAFIKTERIDDLASTEVKTCNESAEMLDIASTDCEVDKENQASNLSQNNANDHDQHIETKISVKCESKSTSPPKQRSPLAASSAPSSCAAVILAKPKVTFANPAATKETNNATSLLAHQTKSSASSGSIHIPQGPATRVVTNMGTTSQFAPASTLHMFAAPVADAAKCAPIPMKIRHVIVKSKTPTMYPK